MRKNTLEVHKLSFTGTIISSFKNLGYTYTKCSYAPGDLNFFQDTGKSNWLIQECNLCNLHGHIPHHPLPHAIYFQQHRLL